MKQYFAFTRKPSFIKSLTTSGAAFLLLLSAVAFSAPDKPWFVDKDGREHPGFTFKFDDKERLARAIRAQEAQMDNLLRKRGVVGTAVGWDEAGNPIIRVFSDGASASDLPKQIDGFAVQLEATGAVYALKYVCRKDNPNRAKQCPEIDESDPASSSSGSTGRHRPVPNGVSIGHPNVTAGTVGCIVTQGCHFLVLSNNHVIADSNAGNIGDLILQPGPFDGGLYPADSVGTLFDWVNIVMSDTAFNRVDAAVALINANDFTNETLPSGYGGPRASELSPQPGMNVMKSGRTTGYTEGVITGVNAIVLVNYNSCCARFIGQVVIDPTAGYSDFALGGDSGSLVVADGGSNNRRPVALIFALANDGSVFANPIDEVTSRLNIDIQGD